MRELQLADARELAAKAREALIAAERFVEPQLGATGANTMATPGKTTLTAQLPVAALGPIDQLRRSASCAAADVTNLEAANRSGDLMRALFLRGLVERFLKQVPLLMAGLPRGADAGLHDRMHELLERASVAVELAPRMSPAALEAARRGDHRQKNEELAPWRARAQATANAEPVDRRKSGRDLISLLGRGGVGATPIVSKPTTAVESTSVADDNEHRIAARGTHGPGQPLPHLAAIQKSFGHHDVSSIRAHIGGAAAAASDALGAEAYAYGDAIAFAAAPNLHTAAHEAAHVVQQRQGVSRSHGGNDSYERHADRVASRVVRGLPVAALLDAAPRGGGSATATVQRKDKGHAGSEPAAEEAAQQSALAMGHEGHKTKFEYQRGNLTGAISLAIEAGKTGIPLGDDHLKAFKNTASIKANGFVSKLETAVVSGSLDREILDGVKLEFEAKALKLSSDGDKTATAPLTIAVKLSGDVTKWFDVNIGHDRKVKLEGSVEVTLGKEFVAKYLAKVAAAEVEQQILVKEMETVAQAMQTHATSVRQLEAQLAAAQSRGLAKRELQALERQVLQHKDQIRAGVRQLERLSSHIAEAQVRAARALGGVKNFLAKKVGKALEKRALKFVAGKLVKIIPVLNAVSIVVDIVDLVVLIHAIIKRKFGSGGGDEDQAGEHAGDSPQREQSTKASSAGSKQETPDRDQTLEIIRAAPPAVIGQWFSARGEELEFNEVGQAWKAKHVRARIGNYELVDMHIRTNQVAVGKWDLHLVFTGRDSAGKLKNAEHDFWVTRGGKAEVGAKVGDLAFEPIMMIDWTGKD